jgi:hypothetical protein
MTVDASGDDGAVVWYSASAWDDQDGDVVPGCAPASGTTFPIGTTTVQCAATDAAGNVAAGTFDVTVQPPLVVNLTISGGSVNPVTGVARVRGTVACSRGDAPPEQPTTAWIDGQVTQRIGRALIRGYFSTQVECTPSASAWSAPTTDSSGLFVAGSVDVNAYAATDPIWSSSSADATIRLKAQR